MIDEGILMNFPERTEGSMTGSQFGASIRDVGPNDARELAIKQQILGGNIPNFMRTGFPVIVSSGSRTGTIFALPDYACVGTDDDYLRCPMNPLTATQICREIGAILPTRKMVNDIFRAALIKLVSSPMDHNGPMMSTGYFIEHNEKIEAELKANGVHCLSVAGHKKDVVLCTQLFDGEPQHHDRVAIYGWAASIDHAGGWHVVQNLNPETHESTYKDYSHGIRFVSNSMIVDGEFMNIEDVLKNPDLCGLISDQGVLPSSLYPNVPL